jgi:hypothetical protein
MSWKPKEFLDFSSLEIQGAEKPSSNLPSTVVMKASACSFGEKQPLRDHYSKRTSTNHQALTKQTQMQTNNACRFQFQHFF